MNTVRTCLLSVVAGILAMSSRSTLAADNLQQAADANTHFAADLLAQVTRNSADKNLFFSPSSISSALAMADAGARGATADQMNKVLHVDDLAATQAGLAEIQQRLTQPAGNAPFELSVANGLWVEKSFPLLPAYLDTTKI
jgi:serpin B